MRPKGLSSQAGHGERPELQGGWPGQRLGLGRSRKIDERIVDEALTPLGTGRAWIL